MRWSSRCGTLVDMLDHDHTAEVAVDIALEDPTPENVHAAHLAVATLQRRYDYVLRRLDRDTGEISAHPDDHHNAALTPEACLDAVLHALAGGLLRDRAATLAHGMTAAQALVSQRDDARTLAARLWEFLPEEIRSEIDVDDYLWHPRILRTQM